MHRLEIRVEFSWVESGGVFKRHVCLKKKKSADKDIPDRVLICIISYPIPLQIHSPTVYQICFC